MFSFVPCNCQTGLEQSLLKFTSIYPSVYVLMLQFKSTALHLAAENGKDATFTLFLDWGADIEAKDKVS